MKSIVFGLLVLCLACTTKEKESNTKGEIQSLELARWEAELNNSASPIILDVRTKEEIEQGTIKGAVHIDYYSDAFDKQIKTLEEGRPVFVYCKRGGRSSAAAKKLLDAGFTKVFNLQGGYDAYSAKHQK